MEDAVVEHALQLEVRAQGGRVDGEALAAHPLGVEGAVPRGDGVARGGGEVVGLARGRWRRRSGRGGGASRRPPRWTRRSRSRRPTRRGGGGRAGGPARRAARRSSSSVARVSCAPPRPRVTDAVCSRSRRSRWVRAARAGCSVGSTRVRRWPSRPRERAARAAAERRVGGEAVELVGVGDVHGGGRGPGEQPVAELGGERRQLGVDRAQPLLLGRAEPGARAHGVAVVALDEPARLGVEARRSATASMRANRAGSSRIASACAASSGATSASTARMPSVLHEAASTKNTAETRRSTSPERSRATIVFSNVGGAGSAAIASTSARWRAMPSTNAGRKCSSRMAEKSG